MLGFGLDSSRLLSGGYQTANTQESIHYTVTSSPISPPLLTSLDTHTCTQVHTHKEVKFMLNCILLEGLHL